jgi:hypothetical protein
MHWCIANETFPLDSLKHLFYLNRDFLKYTKAMMFLNNYLFFPQKIITLVTQYTPS